MNLFLILAFLFCIGAVSGWVIELIFRRFFSSANPERKWINPGFCTGPYVPLYGFGLCFLYLIASFESLPWLAALRFRKLVLFLLMAVTMTLIEYIAGIFLLKVAHLRLWDYSREWGNLQGLICPKFSVIWALLGGAYYFWIHPRILNALRWFSRNLAFSFFIGLFFGVFLLDVAHALQLAAKLQRFARENDVVVRYEHLKLQIRKTYEEKKQKYPFFFPFRSDRPLAEHLAEHLKEMRETFEQRKKPKKSSAR